MKRPWKTAYLSCLRCGAIKPNVCFGRRRIHTRLYQRRGYHDIWCKACRKLMTPKKYYPRLDVTQQELNRVRRQLRTVQSQVMSAEKRQNREEK